MRKDLDLSLYLVTNRKGLAFDEFFKIIDQAVLGGVTMIQLREKETPLHEMILIGKTLKQLLKPRNIPLIINDNITAAKAISADGVHLGQSDLNVNVARSILGSKAIIGLSLETFDQVAYANSCPVDYVAASPVFFTPSKTDCTQEWGIDGLKQLCPISTHPVVAIGGINETNIEQVMECGVSGVAVVSTIHNAACVKTAAHELLTEVKKWR